MNRIPIRLRLTLPFALAVAVVLAAMGFFIYVRVGSQLLETIDANLQAQVPEVLSNAHEGHALVDRDAADGPTVAEIRTPAGGLVAAEPPTLPVLPARRGRFTTNVRGLPGRWRIHAEPSTLDGRRVVVLVGRSLSARADTLSRLAREFVLAAPAALVLAVLLGYALAAAALRPVEEMRRRAAGVTAAEPGRRLPVPEARDEIRSLAVTLNDMLDRLEAAFEHERRFLADASHELRTPLALLRAELEFALRRPRTRPELEAAVRSAAEETERLSRLAEDLLLMARADQGRLPVRAEPLPVEELLERLRDRFAARTIETGRAIRVETAPDDERVAGDPLRIEQALGNLVANAFEHGAGDITLRAGPVDGSVELHVLDEGHGFSPEFVDRAFDRFSRADEARAAGGVGLGLAIVDLIARAHGGSAHAANRSGGGADVWIALPLVPRGR